MYWKLFCTLVVAGMVGGFALAQQEAGQQPDQQDKDAVECKIIKVELNKIVFVPYDHKTKKFGKETQRQVKVQDIKVYRMDKEGKKQPVAGGLKAQALQELGEEGRFATIRMKEGQVLEVVIYESEAEWRKQMKKRPGLDKEGT